MKRRLVEMDQATYALKEIDLVKTRRTAQNLKQWLSLIDPQDDPGGFLKVDLPLVEAALAGMLPLPFINQHPHWWGIRDGLLPSTT